MHIKGQFSILVSDRHWQGCRDGIGSRGGALVWVCGEAALQKPRKMLRLRLKNAATQGCHFECSRVILSDLWKYSVSSMTRSFARSHQNSWVSCCHSTAMMLMR